MKCHSLMIVDDDAGICESLSELLETEGYKFVVACDGKQALEKIFKLKRPALIFLDLRMPEMTGEEFLVRLREHKIGHNGDLDHVVVMTATNVSKIKLDMADEIIQKPMDISEIMSIIEKHMEPEIIAQAQHHRGHTVTQNPESNYL